MTKRRSKTLWWVGAAAVVLYGVSRSALDDRWIGLSEDLVSALAIVGETQAARDLMERLLRVASPLGLYAEEFETETGSHLGNFPQAFSHLALIEAAARIILAEQMEELNS